MILPSLSIAIFVFMLDQSSKMITLNALREVSTISVWPFLDFTLARNHGAAFGLLAHGDGWQRWLFVAVALIISIVIVCWCAKLTRKDWWETAALGCILGGAWGNMVDRLRFGHVVDFIDFYIGNWHWYTFNVADIAICMGAVILLFMSVKKV